jgi:predicted AAA+ superfamily ATPase
MAKARRWTSEEEAWIRDMLLCTHLPRDAIPYSEEFPRLKQKFEAKIGRSIGNAEFWQALDNVGKKGIDGPRKKRVLSPKLAVEHQLELLRLLPEGIGTRDRLPYTPKFDELHRRFGKLTDTKLNKHEFWLAVSSVAKKSRKPEPLFQSAPVGELPQISVEILEFLNPWWRGLPTVEVPRFRRWGFDAVWQRLHVGNTSAVIVRGPRRVGKSTIQQQIVEQLLLIDRVSPARILRVQFDDVPLGTVAEPVVSIVKWFEKNVLQSSINAHARQGKPVYLLFDEVQNLDHWTSQIKSLVDHVSARILVTGSSSLRMAESPDSLAGRAAWIELGPLRLREIAGLRDISLNAKCCGADILENWGRREFWTDLARLAAHPPHGIADAFAYFSERGGFPTCHSNPKELKSVLKDGIFSSVIQHTIEHDNPLARRRRPPVDRAVLRHAFRMVCRYAGQAVRPDTIAQEISDVYGTPVTPTTITKAVDFFADSMLIRRIEPLEFSAKRQKQPAKLCLCDHFLREALLGEQIPLTSQALRKTQSPVQTLAGHIVESVLGYTLESVPGLEVNWFPQRKGEPEVDFVVTVGLQRIPIEVKYTHGRPKAEDWAGIETFCRQPKYDAPFGLLITQNTAGELGEHTIAIPLPILLAAF